MFGLFNKKEKPVPVTDLVWLNAASKNTGLLQMLKDKPAAILAAWFDDTIAEIENLLQQYGIAIQVHSCRQLRSSLTTGREVIMLEHYPLFKKEQELFKSFSAAAITVLSSLDEPLFIHFGGERIAAIMKAMGAGEEEAVSHAMISNSLQKAQQKLEKEVTVEMQAASPEEWFRKNSGGK